MFFANNEKYETYPEIIRRLHHEYGEELQSKINTITKQNNELSNKLKTMSDNFIEQQNLVIDLYKIFNSFLSNKITRDIDEILYTYKIVAKLKNGSTITYSTDEFALIEHIRQWWKYYNRNIALKHAESLNHTYSYDFYHFYLDVFTLSRSEILSLDIKVA